MGGDAGVTEGSARSSRGCVVATGFSSRSAKASVMSDAARAWSFSLVRSKGISSMWSVGIAVVSARYDGDGEGIIRQGGEEK